MNRSSVPISRLVEQTHAVWQPRIRRTLTNEDARQIAENVVGFFATLAEWSRAAQLRAANDALLLVPIDQGEVSHER